MRLPRFERGIIEEWVAGVETNMRWVKRGDHHKRQGGLLGGILNGGTSLIGDILNVGNPKTTTTTAQAPRTTTNAVSNPAPVTSVAPAPTQAPPATTQAPTPAPPVVTASTAPTVVVPPVQVTPSPSPSAQQPTPSSVQVIKTSTIPIAIPILTATLLPTSLPGKSVSPITNTISVVPISSILSSAPKLSTGIPSSITSPGPNFPTTFATSTLSPSTSTLIEDLTTMNPIMGTTMSGMGKISRMTIIISILAILFGSILIFSLCFFISKKYIRKRKITIALDMRISQLQQGDGPLPPVPMRMKMRNDAMEFILRFPRPPSLRRMGRGSKERQREGFEVIR